MNKNVFTPILLLITIFCFGQPQTVGLFKHSESSFEGYTLFNSIFGTDTYLIDNCGRIVNHWPSEYTPGNSVYLLENGNLLTTAKSGLNSNPVFAFGGAGEKVQIKDWENNLIWEYIYSDETHRMHHDISYMNNGNILILAWELKSAEEAIAKGRNPDLLAEDVMWFEHVIEVDPNTDQIVWEWHMFDHLIQDFDEAKSNYGVIGDNEQLMNINFVDGSSADGRANWMQMNAMDYHETMDQILLSSRFLSEIYVIDHSTTSDEAASHSGGNSGMGGDILYRWGNPQAYDQGTEDDQKLFGQHSAYWIPQGIPDGEKIMLFNNGTGRPDGAYSTVEIIVPAMDDYFAGTYFYIPGNSYGPKESEWIYKAVIPTDFYSSFISSAQRLPNGNTLICQGQDGYIFEIDQEEQIIWEYINPSTSQGSIKQGEAIPITNGRNANITFRATKYALDYPAFEGRNLAIGDPIELEPLENDCESKDVLNKNELTPNMLCYPNPAKEYLFIEGLQLGSRIEIFNSSAQLIYTLEVNESITKVNLRHFDGGMYFVKAGEVIQRVIKIN